MGLPFACGLDQFTGDPIGSVPFHDFGEHARIRAAEARDVVAAERAGRSAANTAIAARAAFPFGHILVFIEISTDELRIGDQGARH